MYNYKGNYTGTGLCFNRKMPKYYWNLIKELELQIKGNSKYFGYKRKLVNTEDAHWQLWIYLLGKYPHYRRLKHQDRNRGLYTINRFLWKQIVDESYEINIISKLKYLWHGIDINENNLGHFVYWGNQYLVKCLNIKTKELSNV